MENAEDPTTTQYPDMEEEEGMGLDPPPDTEPSRLIAKPRDEPGQGLCADQRAANEPLPTTAQDVVPEMTAQAISDDEQPAGTQYPDIDDEEEVFNCQPASRMPDGPAAGLPDTQSDFDAELEDFLAEQVCKEALSLSKVLMQVFASKRSIHRNREKVGGYFCWSQS